MGLLNSFRKEGAKKRVNEEVVENLKHILNTKADFGAWQKQLGLQHYASNTSTLEMVNEIIGDITQNIEQYEKRMKIVEVKAIQSSSQLRIRFQIDCMIGEQFHSFYIGFKKKPELGYVEVEDGSDDEN